MKFSHKLIKILPTKPVFAHCDIPCGIYDPHRAQLAAHTIIRMTKLILDLNKEVGDEAEKKFFSQLSRITKVKEEHGEIVESELVTLWADYFKEEHLKDYPELHDLVWKTIKLSGKARQEINMDAANELLTNVQKIAEIFWKTKGLEVIRIPSGYPTEGEIVSHK